MDWNEIWTSVVNFFATNGLQLLYAILVLIVGLIVIKIINKIVAKLLAKTKLERIAQGFIRSIVKVLLYMVLIFAVLQMFGIPITGLVTVLATAGAAVALSLKDSLANVASGMIIITTKPFKQNDYIQVDDLEGTVNSIKIMNTEIITSDNKTIVIPNSTIMSSELINYTTQGSRFVEMTFDVAYETNIELAKKIILDVCHSNGNIMLDPAPSVNLKYFKDSGMSLFLSCKTKAPYWSVYYYIMEHVYNEFKRNGISLSYNQLEVHMRTETPTLPFNKEPLPERIEPKAEPKIEHLSLFDANAFSKIHKQSKQKKIKNLEKKRKDLDTQLTKLKADLPSTRVNKLIEFKSIVLKNKKAITRPTEIKHYHIKKA